MLAVVLYPQITSSTSEYDPWLDINDDGKIRVDDILSVALAYGSDGDSTKNVTVTNFPQVWEMKMVYSSLNLSLASNVLIQAGQSKEYTVDVQGYSHFTIGFDASPNQVTVYIHFVVGGLDFQVYDKQGPSYLWEHITAYTPTIRIVVWNYGSSAIFFSLGFYACS